MNKIIIRLDKNNAVVVIIDDNKIIQLTTLSDITYKVYATNDLIEFAERGIKEI